MIWDSRRLFLIASLLWSLSPSHPAFAIDRDRRISQLHHTAWTPNNGAPGEVRALAQTTDGYLWLGGPTGLYRFDGVRFEQYKPPSGPDLPRARIDAMLATPDGGLWIGYQSGDISFLKNGAVKTYGEQDGVPPTRIGAFLRDRQGTLWAVAGRGGLLRLEGARWRTIGSDWGFSGMALSVYEDRNETLWVGTVDKVFFLHKGARQFQVAADHLQFVMKFGEAPDGTLWMTETGRSVRPVPLASKPQTLTGPEIVAGSQFLLFDDQGSLWIASLGDGIRRVQDPALRSPALGTKPTMTAESYMAAQGLSGNFMYCLLQDREGNVWAGTNAGVDRFRQSAFVPVALPPDGPISAIFEGDDNMVFAGILPMGPIQRIRDGVANPLKDALHHVDTAFRDPSGIVWLTNRFQLFRFANEQQHPVDPAREFIRPREPWMTREGMVMRTIALPEAAITISSRAIALTRERSGRLWLSVEGKGVYRLNGATWITLESLGGPKGGALAAFTDSLGRSWFGFQNGTVAVVEGDTLRTFTRKDGVPAGNISSIQGSGPDVWIGGNNGVALFSGGRFHPLIPAVGEEFSGITGLIASSGLWLNERRGIVHISAGEIRLFQGDPGHRVNFELFDLRDGLPQHRPGSIASPSALQTTNGLLWFATPGGLVWLDPKRIPRNALPPPVVIETLVANGQRHSATAPLALPAHTGNLNIEYTALSLTIPERVRFRYQLDGVDKGWQDVGTRREAFYTNLGPGTYRFRVKACNNEGIWNEAGAALDFTIAPAYYQTWWFLALCGLAGLAALWLLYLLRVRQVTAQVHARLGERMAERERIARELHDTLLQSVQGLMLHFEAAVRKLPGQDPIRPVIESALRTAEQVVIEGRDRVRDLRSASAPVEDLAALLSRCGEEFKRTTTTAFKVSVVGTPHSLDPIVRDEVHAIGREALVNAFRHAQAATIEVEITYARIALRLRVRDDGRGVNQQTLDEGMPDHWGLSGMRERAQKLGGHVSLWSRPGAGTEVDLTIPAKVAYPRAPQLSPKQRLKLRLQRHQN